MIFLVKSIKCKFSGNEKYRPENMKKAKEFLPVVSYRITKKTIVVKGVSEQIEIMSYGVIGDDGKMVFVSQQNCKIMVDDGMAERALLSISQSMGTVHSLAAKIGDVLDGGSFPVRVAD